MILNHFYFSTKNSSPCKNNYAKQTNKFSKEYSFDSFINHRLYQRSHSIFTNANGILIKVSNFFHIDL